MTKLLTDIPDLSDVETPAWDLAKLVSSLRTARLRQTDWRRDEAERPERPSRETLHAIVKNLRAALFPSHFGVSDFSERVRALGAARSVTEDDEGHSQ